jgi:hypothetical protein
VGPQHKRAGNKAYVSTGLKQLFCAVVLLLLLRLLLAPLHPCNRPIFSSAHMQVP